MWVEEKLFNMVKLRSMVIMADKSGVASTAANDNRITNVGRLIRRYKLDEFMQLWNVLLGQMSLVVTRYKADFFNDNSYCLAATGT